LAGILIPKNRPSNNHIEENMTTRTILKLMLLTIILLPLNPGFAQNSEGRWALGFHGGGNLWINDYSTSIVGAGGEVMLRYGIHRALSAGLLVGYEEFKAEQDLPLSGQPSTFLKLHAIPASFVAWAHLAAGEKVNPYIYAGIGARLWTWDRIGRWREDGFDNSGLWFVLGAAWGL
jgi:hypothetical protein